METKELRIVVAANKNEQDAEVRKATAFKQQANSRLSKFQADTGYKGVSTPDVRNMLYQPDTAIQIINSALTKFCNSELDQAGITSQMMRQSFTGNVAAHVAAFVSDINRLQSLPGAGYIDELKMIEGQLELTLDAENKIRERFMNIITNPKAKELLDLQKDTAEKIQQLWDFVHTDTTMSYFILNQMLNTFFAYNAQTKKVEIEYLDYDRVCNKANHAKAKADYEKLRGNAA